MTKHLIPTLTVCSIVASLVTGCGENAPPTAGPTNDKPLTKSGANASAGAPKASASLVSNGAPVPPVDARLTLYCYAVDGVDHVARANQLKDQLIQKTGLKDFYIIHSGDQSAIYFGYYKDFTGNQNPKEKQRANADKAKIANITDDRGSKPFRAALFVDVDTPDPTGPPEWNLANTPADRMWTLQIGVYYDSPERKQFAVDAVREARAQGLEAFYYHGQSASSVCVGAFPREALREQETGDARTYNSDEPILVLPAPLPKGLSGDAYVNDDGKKLKVRALAPRVEVVDPNLLALMKQFPNHVVNGEVQTTTRRDARTGKRTQVAESSQIWGIVHAGDALAGRTQPGVPNQALINPTGPVRPRPASGAGQLRGLGN